MYAKQEKICENNYDFALLEKVKGKVSPHNRAHSTNPHYSQHWKDFRFVSNAHKGMCMRILV